MINLNNFPISEKYLQSSNLLRGRYFAHYGARSHGQEPTDHEQNGRVYAQQASRSGTQKRNYEVLW